MLNMTHPKHLTTDIEPTNVPEEHLLLAAKFEKFHNYIYPILQNIPRKHGMHRNLMIQLVDEFVAAIFEAAEANQPSKVKSLSGKLSNIRYKLRFTRRFNMNFSIHQLEVSQSLLSEVGKIIGSWKKKLKS